MKMMDLTGTTTVVTGGADGIGFGLASAFAKRGSKVAILDIRLGAAEDAVARLQASGHEAVAVECDIAEAGSVVAAASSVEARLGPVNVLWCNAGVGGIGRLSEAQPDDLDWMYAVNVHGTLNTYRTFLPAVRAASGVRHVGFTGSSNTLGHIGPSQVGTYAATKWAVVGIAEAAAGELVDDGIGVTIFCPGLVNTNIWDAARARPDRFGGVNRMPDRVGDRWRTEGGSVEWAVDAALAAFDEGRLYANPVEEHSKRQFAARNDEVLAGFVTRPDQQSALADPAPNEPTEHS
ncbi:MAG: SDR family NAD(P)-dependent oxidoreductase [Acidimicrobiales bacterium]